MKLQQNTNTIVRSGSFEESNYTIEASAKAFSILSDGLYADKIKAVIRELSTNAYDAHVDAGYPEKPFTIHLPNRFDPKFLIRDYGTGLSHENCMNLYTTYFGSNKTDSNDAVGCLGLGSKSPFAYTDNFIVISYFDGKKRTYNSYKNERDEPVFALMDEQDTNEPVGMEIVFSVEQDDIEEFEETAQEVYKHFKVLPMLIGENSTEPLEIEDELEFVIHGSNWGIVNSGGYSRYEARSSAIAIMGQVAYPIDYEQFEGEDVEALLKSEVHIHFGIGDLDITPSREALSYNEYTKRAIKETVECILLEMKEVIEESFDECETMFEARMKYYQLSDSGNVLNRVVGIFDKAEVTWKDTPLWDGETAFLRVPLPESLLKKDNPRNIFREDWKVTIRSENVQEIRFDHRKEMHFLFDDVKRGGIGRAKHYIKKLVGDEKYSSHNKDMAYLFTGGVTKEEVIEALQCKESDLILTSTLPSPTKSSRSYNSGGEVRSKVCVWKEGSGGSYWKDIEIDMSEGGFYVEINRYDIVDLRGSRMSYRNTSDIVKHMTTLGYDFGVEEGEKPVVYGIKSQELKKKKFNQDDNWINLLEAGLECYKDAVPAQLEWREDYNYWNRKDDHYNTLEKITSKLDKVPEVMSNYLKESKAHEERKEWVECFENLASVVDQRGYNYHDYNVNEIYKDLDRDKIDEANPWPAKWEALLEKYPMVNFLLEELCSWGIEDRHVGAIVDYIKMVDRCKNIDALLR